MSKILIVEKDKNFSSNICEILELYEYKTEQCYETQNIEEQIRKSDPNLLILSISIDYDQSGIEIMQRLLPDHNLPVVIISDNYLKELFNGQLKEIKNSIIINKPFTAKELLAAVKSLI
ncbi:response regulator [Echinicola shivajiensis]|uniref:response regulator n=1 Tax=Echinicola shivajiensis TaxID=1035916 RepID=UPI001BFCB2C2|nr:response regulator [Echinicola shivajiensis]